MGELVINIDPLEVAFSYKKLSPNFSGCGRSLQHTLDDILEGRLSASDLPQIAVLAMPNVGSERTDTKERKGKGNKKNGGKGSKSKRIQRDESSDEEPDSFFSSNKQGQAGSSGSGGIFSGGRSSKAGSVGLPVPVAQRYRYFSLNNRRLWVLRQARLAGKITGAVACRLKPSDVCERLLAPGAKGSRTFRLDRVCDDAYIYQDQRQRRREPTDYVGEVPSAEATSGDAEQINSSTTAPSAEISLPSNAPSANVQNSNSASGGSNTSDFSDNAAASEALFDEDAGSAEGSARLVDDAQKKATATRGEADADAAVEALSSTLASNSLQDGSGN